MNKQTLQGNIKLIREGFKRLRIQREKWKETKSYKRPVLVSQKYFRKLRV